MVHKVKSAQAATLGSLGKLGNKLRIYPDRVIDTMDNVEDLVANEQKVVVWVGCYLHCIDIESLKIILFK